MKIKIAAAGIAVLFVGLLTFGFLRYLPLQVGAFNPQPDPPGFGMAGIAEGQTMRINVVNTALPAQGIPPDPCRVVMTFRNEEGDLVRNSDGNVIRRVELLQAGRSVSLDLNANSLVREAAGRAQVRPVVTIQQADPVGDNASPPDPCIPSAEVFNNANGRTQFMVPAVFSQRTFRAAN